MQWDIFCRVIDNFGDLGVCWRLAADLGGRGESVRLWVDEPSMLAWMAPQGAPGVELRRWDEAEAATDAPGDVVVEAFACDPPAGFVARMAAAPRPPVWINLEYLSAEDWVERVHGLPSPQLSGPGKGLVKHFFHPGFTAATGGLLREPGLIEARAAFDAPAWLASRGLRWEPDERRVSLFCYDNPALPALLDSLQDAPTRLFAATGHPARQLGELLGVPARPGDSARRGMVTVDFLPPLPQPDYDRLLWSCELNFVRGEDSFVRAQWAGAPFVWQIYPQDDGVHAVKLDAFLERHLDGAPPVLASAVRTLWHRWNGLAEPSGPLHWPQRLDWTLHCHRWRDQLAERADLCSQLLGFVRAKG
ncbi:elongation factor P maturation arginine rhamnosyltransferase EarP [Caldimonas tepidiphila]|uniref:elongation factor P maturation arginine rhamnosyltransferase EarP n=1 Tax=Caldimonas tepidiphila TaxID=2315841 RepID=UPI00196AC22F|nr:elongation factor P maturation arginine rhamnosyltransferase EarP [Caldimonas tepidiphila]